MLAQHPGRAANRRERAPLLDFVSSTDFCSHVWCKTVIKAVLCSIENSIEILTGYGYNEKAEKRGFSRLDYTGN